MRNCHHSQNKKFRIVTFVDLKGKILLLSDSNVAFCQKVRNGMRKKISFQRHNFIWKNALFCCLLSIGIGLANDSFINNGLILNSDAHTYKLPSTYSYLKKSNFLSCAAYDLLISYNISSSDSRETFVWLYGLVGAWLI